VSDDHLQVAAPLHPLSVGALLRSPMPKGRLEAPLVELSRGPDTLSAPLLRCVVAFISGVLAWGPAQALVLDEQQAMGAVTIGRGYRATRDIAAGETILCENEPLARVLVPVKRDLLSLQGECVLALLRESKGRGVCHRRLVLEAYFSFWPHFFRMSIQSAAPWR